MPIVLLTAVGGVVCVYLMRRHQTKGTTKIEVVEMTDECDLDKNQSVRTGLTAKKAQEDADDEEMQDSQGAAASGK